MEHNLAKISKTLLDMSRFADVVLYTTAKGRASSSAKGFDVAQRSLIERIDGFRSMEQILAISGDLISVHAALGKLIALGFVTTDEVASRAPAPVATKPSGKEATRPIQKVPKSTAASAKPVAKAQPPDNTNGPLTASAPLPAGATELDRAKHLLLTESRLVLGADAATRMRPRVLACKSIEEIYDLIVKVQQHLAKGGKVNPDVFIERLSKGLATARKGAVA